MSIKKFFGSILEVIVIGAVAILAVVLCRQYVFNPYVISGTSMVPTFHDGDYVFVDELTYHFRAPARGDVVVFHGDAPGINGEDLIKRIIGLPGEEVKVGDGTVTIVNATNPGDNMVLKEPYLPSSDVTTCTQSQSQFCDVTLGANQYFVMGDNRPVSDDSRTWGALDKNEIVGLVRLRIWPLNAATAFTDPKY